MAAVDLTAEEPVAKKEEPKKDKQIKMKPIIRLKETIDISFKDEHLSKSDTYIKGKVKDAVKLSKTSSDAHGLHDDGNARRSFYLILNDNANFYQIDMATKKITTYAGKF